MAIGRSRPQALREHTRRRLTGLTLPPSARSDRHWGRLVRAVSLTSRHKPWQNRAIAGHQYGACREEATDASRPTPRGNIQAGWIRRARPPRPRPAWPAGATRAAQPESGPEARPSRREAFDELVLSLVERLAQRWESGARRGRVRHRGRTQIPDDWGDEPVPFGSYVAALSGQPARIVVFRRPVELRAATQAERTALVNEILIEHIAELLGRDPSEIDP